MAITLPLLKTLRRADVVEGLDAYELLSALEEKRETAERLYKRGEKMGSAFIADYYAGRNDGLIDAMQEIREMMEGR